MKCEIIKDLLPSYIDGLTSNESNFEIEEHLKGCSECSEILKEMKAKINTENIKVNKEKIKPFKKLNRKILKSVLITLISCILAAGIYLYLIGIGWSVKSNDLKKTYSHSYETININFELTNGKVLNAWHNRQKKYNELKFTQSFNSSWDNRGKHPNCFSYGINYRDENGKKKIFTDNDYVILHFKDKTETICWKDIAESLKLQ